MTIGLLECDHVNPEFRAIAGDYRDMFTALFPGLHWAFFDACAGQFPDDPACCDAYMCTGSRLSVYDEVDWVLALKAFVRTLYERRITFVGLCFGHQMLAEALGGKVEKAPSGWNVGVHTFEILEQEAWMIPPRSRLNVPMMCQDQVLRLPEAGVVLARTVTCPVAMFRVGTHMLGIQGHPEFPKAYEQQLMESRRERIGAAKVEEGLASLTLPVDAEVVGEWVLRFLGK